MLRRVLCAAWVRECCVRPCVRVSVACCMHPWGLLPPIDMFIFQASYGDTPSIPKYGVKSSLCSQIRSKILPLFPNTPSLRVYWALEPLMTVRVYKARDTNYSLFPKNRSLLLRCCIGAGAWTWLTSHACRMHVPAGHCMCLVC